MIYIKKTVFFSLLFIFYFSLNAQNLKYKKHKLNSAIKILKFDKDMQNAGIGFIAIDVNSGEVLSELNPNLALTPASTQKLITTATSLEVLGANYRFETKIEYTGKIDTNTNVLDGNIIIKGGGDPTLGSKYFEETKNHIFIKNWVDAISSKGIKLIDGQVIADARLYGYDIVPSTWVWEDMGNYFGAGACGLTIYDNFYTIYFNTSNKVGGKTKIVKIEPNIDGLIIDNQVKSMAVRSDNSYIFGAPYTYFRYIQGSLPLNKKNFKVKGSLPDPAYFASKELKNNLKKIKNIASGTATTFRINPGFSKFDSLKHTLIYTSKSPELKKIIKQTNFRSINLFAEHLYKQSQLKLCDFNSNKINKSFIEDFWALRGINTNGMNIYDGCGLSKYNTLTARQMADVLAYMKTKSPNSEDFYNSIAKVGKEGTVKSMCKGSSAENNMRAKSGSIRNVRAYAGYVTTVSGRDVAFSLIINNYNGKSKATRKKMEKIMIALADFNL